MGTRRLAANESEFLEKLNELFINQCLVGDRLLPVYIHIPGDPRMFTKNINRGDSSEWEVLSGDYCSLRQANGGEVDELLDAIHEDQVQVFACSRWTSGHVINPVAVLHNPHGRGWECLR
jgi:hypothetical protein